MKKILALLVLACLPSPLSAAIKGTVMSIEGAPLSGARVEAYLPESTEARDDRLLSENPKRTAIVAATSDAAGNFVLDLRKQPVVDVAIEASGYEPITLILGGDDDAGAIALRPAAPTSGVITAGGKAVANARVIFSSGPTELVTITDGEGRYTAPDPLVWATSVAIHHPDFASVFERASRRKLTLNHQLVTGAAVSGKVVGEDGETPIAGAKVTALGRRAMTQEDGTFTLEHIAEKRPPIRVTAGERVGVDLSTQRTVTIKLSKAATITGVVRDAKSQKPLPGARVAFGQAMTDSVLTDPSGAFTIRNVASGRQRLWISYPNYSFSPMEADARPGEKVSKTIAGTQNATVLGTVIDETKRAIAATRIVAAPVEDSFTGPRFPGQQFQPPTFSAPDGRYVLRNVAPDTQVELAARKKGLPPGNAGPFRLASGEIKRGVAIILPRGIAVSGKVLDRDGRPVAGVAVIATEVEDRFSPGMRRVIRTGPGERESNIETRHDGTFVVQLKEGRYDFLFRREGYAPKRLRAFNVVSNPEPIEVTIDRGAEIAGRVVRRDGSGVAEVNINVMADASGPPEPIRTAADGSFVVPDLNPGPVMLLAMKPEDFIREMRNVTAPSSDVVIEIAPGARIEGRVVEKGSNRPITQFRAGVTNSMGGRGMVFRGPPMIKPFTAEDGSFVLENVPAGKVDLTVEAAGYVDGRLPGLVVEEGKTLRDIQVELEAGVRLSGKVTSPDGAPLSGVMVAADAEPGAPAMPGFGIERGITDGEGEYSIDSIEPGEKTFVFRKEGYLTERKTAKLSGREARLDVRLSRGKEAGGVVMDESGAPVANANITARSGVQDAGFRSTRSDPNGAFRFEGLAPGRYTFRAEKMGYVSGEAKDVDLDAAAAGLRITLTGGGTIAGHVSGLTEAELSSASAYAVGSSGRRASAPIDSSGNFRLEGVPTGTVRVAAEAGGFQSRRATPPKTVEVAAGSEMQVELEFKSDIIVRGRVTRQGKPLVGAMVLFSAVNMPQTRASGRTDHTGNYEINILEPGKYNVSVADMATGTGYDTAYEVTGSATFDIEIRGSEIRGRVIDADSGAPIVDAMVSLQKAQANSPLGVFTTGTDPSGTFVFDTISPGTYRARAQKEKYGQAIAEVTVSDNDRREIELKLTRNDGARLRVVDARDGRALAPFVWIRDSQGRSAYEGMPRPNSEGVLAVPLAPGGYRATVSAQGYAAKTVSLVVPSQEIRMALSPGGSIVIQSKLPSRERGRLMTPSGEFFQRGPWAQPQIALDPGTTVLEYLVPGAYVLQLLDERGNVKNSYSVTVVEGQAARVEI